MVQIEFANNAKKVLESDDKVLGLAVGGSWLTNQIDEFSDLDLILVTKEKISGDRTRMISYARQLGDFLSGFTGEHVGEPRVLICMYDNPILHVDIKFLTVEELVSRVETPVVLMDKEGKLQEIFDNTKPAFPYPDYQWIEDRFWTWIHYALLKIGRGEYLKALDFFGFLRMTVLGPLLHIKTGNLPRGVRKVETELTTSDFRDLRSTISAYDKNSLLVSLRNSVELYRNLRSALFGEEVQWQTETEKSVIRFFDQVQTST